MVAPAQRWSVSRKCPICGGWDGAPRGAGKRCTGYLSSDGEWILCTRPEYAGAIEPKGEPGAETFAHRRYGECKCDVQHGPAVATSAPARRERDVEATYDYFDENGDLLFQVVRKVGKQFLQRRPVPDDGTCSACGKDHHGWLWTLSDAQAESHGLPKARRVLYHLPELLGAPTDELVVLAEGEKDVDALRRLGFVATCNPMGAGKWSFVAKHAQEVLRDRTCIVIADDDEPDEKTGKRVGHEHAKQIAKTLGCAWLTLPGAKDAAQWIANGGTAEQLRELASAANAALETKRAAKSERARALSVVRGDWTRELLYKWNEDGSEKSSLRPVVANVITILVHDERWSGVIAYNEFSESIVTRKRGPWRHQENSYAYEAGTEWNDEDTTRTQAWLSAEYKLDVSPDVVRGAVAVMAQKQKIHDVRDWLETLKYPGSARDAAKRCETWLIDVFGVEDSPYVRAVSRMFLISAVARAYRPGCKVDTTLVLEGKSGIRKSTVLKELVNDKWFFEMAVSDLASLDAMQTLRGKWIFEMAEMDQLGKPQKREATLSFLARRTDRYRSSYGRKHEDRPRQCAGIGTTNKEQWITDDTGAMGRRVWPVRCTMGDENSVQIVRQIREQLWAAAVVLYKAGEPWHFVDPDLEDAARAEQDARYLNEPVEQQIARWVYARPEGEFKSRAEMGVTGEDVMSVCLGIQAKDRTQALAMMVGRVMRKLGWVLGPQTTRGGIRVRLYRPETTDAADDPNVVPLPPAIENDPASWTPVDDADSD